MQLLLILTIQKPPWINKIYSEFIDVRNPRLICAGTQIWKTGVRMEAHYIIEFKAISGTLFTKTALY